MKGRLASSCINDVLSYVNEGKAVSVIRASCHVLDNQGTLLPAVWIFATDSVWVPLTSPFNNMKYQWFEQQKKCWKCCNTAPDVGLSSSSEVHSPQHWLWEGKITSLLPECSLDNLLNPFAVLSLAKTFYECPFQASLGANCRYQSRLNRFLHAIKCSYSFPSARTTSVLATTERERKQFSPVTQTKPQLCLMCQNPTIALHTINIKLRCWKLKTWRQQKIHNSTQNSQRAVFCFYCLFFLINTIAFVQIPLLSCYKQCSMCFLTH